MNDSYFIYQSKPAATTLTDAFTVPPNTSLRVKSIVACNQGAATTLRISVAPTGVADSLEQYLYYDVAIGANSTLLADFDLPLPQTAVVRVYSASGDVSFTFAGEA